jgi:hypothetical protein
MRYFVENIPNNFTTKIGGNLGSRGKDVFYCIMATQKKRIVHVFLCNQNEMRISVEDLYQTSFLQSFVQISKLVSD